MSNPHSRSSSSPCPYAALGIPRTADAAAIKRAFVEAAKASHPDLLPSGSTSAERRAAAERFAAVAEAYAVVGDASRTAAFDRMGSSSASAAGGGYYRPASNAYNPYSGGFRPSSSSSDPRRRPPSLFSNLFRLVVSRSSRGDGWAHLALAAAAIGGAALAATAGDDLWRAANKGKLFEDVVAAERPRRRRRKEEETSASSAAASPSASSSPSPAVEPSQQQQQRQALE